MANEEKNRQAKTDCSTREDNDHEREEFQLTVQILLDDPFVPEDFKRAIIDAGLHLI